MLKDKVSLDVSPLVKKRKQENKNKNKRVFFFSCFLIFYFLLFCFGNVNFH